MCWYAIRTVYQFGTKRNGVNLLEERVVCFHAQTWPEAHARAEAEAAEYASENGFTAHPEQSGISRTVPLWWMDTRSGPSCSNQMQT
jgi:hypothetical protein